MAEGILDRRAALPEGTVSPHSGILRIATAAPCRVASTISNSDSRDFALLFLQTRSRFGIGDFGLGMYYVGTRWTTMVD